MDLIHLSEWTHECLFVYFSVEDLSFLSMVSKEMNKQAYAYAVRSLQKECKKHNLATSSNNSSNGLETYCNCTYCQFRYDNSSSRFSSNTSIQIQQNQSNNNRNNSILSKIAMSPIRAMRFQRRLNLEQRLNLLGCSTLACGEKHTIVSISMTSDLKYYGFSDERDNEGLTLACGSTYNNLLGVPLSNVDDLDGKRSIFSLSGPSAYSNHRTEAVAVSKEHTVCLERGGRAIWVWGGKFHQVTRVPIDMITMVETIDKKEEMIKAVGIGAGSRSFSVVLMNNGDIYSVQSIEVEPYYVDGVYKTKQTLLERLDIAGFKAKSVSVSGTCMVIVTWDGEVVIFTVNRYGTRLVSIEDQIQNPFDIINIETPTPLYKIVEGTEISSTKRLMVRSICAADKYIGIVTTDGKLYHVGASPLRFGAPTLMTPMDENGNSINVPRQVLGNLENEMVCQVSCGPLHTMALTASGKVFSWGFNGSGRLGLGHENDVHKPTLVPLPGYKSNENDPNGPKAVGISAGFHHSAVLLDSGKLLTFGGIGNDGRLGHTNYSMMSQCCLKPSPILASSRRNIFFCELISLSKSLIHSNSVLAYYFVLFLRSLVIFLGLGGVALLVRMYARNLRDTLFLLFNAIAKDIKIL